MAAARAVLAAVLIAVVAAWLAPQARAACPEPGASVRLAGTTYVRLPGADVPHAGRAGRGVLPGCDDGAGGFRERAVDLAALAGVDPVLGVGLADAPGSVYVAEGPLALQRDHPLREAALAAGAPASLAAVGSCDRGVLRFEAGVRFPPSLRGEPLADRIVVRLREAGGATRALADERVEAVVLADGSTRVLGTSGPVPALEVDDVVSVVARACALPGTAGPQLVASELRLVGHEKGAGTGPNRALRVALALGGLVVAAGALLGIGALLRRRERATARRATR